MGKYLIMMVIRVTCFVLMLLVQPYSWYTGVFAVGAIFLPYVAVVIANVASGSAESAIAPERALTAGPAPAPSAAAAANVTGYGNGADPSGVIRIHESPRPAASPRPAQTPPSPPASTSPSTGDDA